MLRGRCAAAMHPNDELCGTCGATVDATFRDGTGAPRFLIACILVKENGAWKLDQQTSARWL